MATQPTDKSGHRASNTTPIQVRGLVKAYGDRTAVDGIDLGDRTAVDGIDLDVERGEVLALLGPNGAGKTTTVEVLEGYRARDAGKVSVLGEDPARADRLEGPHRH